MALSKSIYSDPSQHCFLIQVLNVLTWMAPAACPLFSQPLVYSSPLLTHHIMRIIILKHILGQDQIHNHHHPVVKL